MRKKLPSVRNKAKLTHRAWNGARRSFLNFFATYEDKVTTPLTDTFESYLNSLWESLRKEYFPNEVVLMRYKVNWSQRAQVRTLASCNVHSKIVKVAKELRTIEAIHILSPLLYHEMCHAVLGVRKTNNGRYLWHDKVFKDLERRHPDIGLLNQWIDGGGWSKLVNK
jgi:hypothetical protein